MKLIDDDIFDLAVAANEKITVKIVKSIGVVDLINYSWNGSDPVLPKQQPYERTPFGTNPNPSHLGVMIHFAGDDGGSFTIEVRGVQGGDVSSYDYDQGEGETFKPLIYDIRKA
jgi:hypothetical protein